VSTAARTVFRYLLERTVRIVSGTSLALCPSTRRWTAQRGEPSMIRFAAPALLAALLAGTLAAPPANAIAIQLQPVDTNALVGDLISIDVFVSGLASPELGGEIVSAFDLDVLYDPSILNATSISFGNALGLADVDTFTSSFFSTGRIDFANVSLLLNDDLDLLQGDSILLASLTFSAIGIGQSLLSFDALTSPGIDLVGRDPFTRLPIDFAGSAQVTIGERPVSVPEPGMLALLAIGLLGLGTARRIAR
jgi:hypothetical protein